MILLLGRVSGEDPISVYGGTGTVIAIALL